LTPVIVDGIKKEITVEDISKMKYLHQCILETMRMFPVVPLIGRVISTETKIGPYIIPKGTTAMVAPFAGKFESNTSIPDFSST
jgi:cytochrome P450 family 4